MTEVPLGRLAGSWTLGLALGLFGVTTVQRFEELLQSGPSMALIASLAMLACLALGMSLPDRYAQHFSRLHSSLSSEATEVTAAQLQTLFAASCVLGGLAIMAVNLLAPPLGHLSVSALESFHWTALTSQALDFVLLCGYVLIPCGLLGMALNCTQRVTFLHTPRMALSMCTVVLGLPVGLVLGSMLDGLSPSGTELIAALLLLFSGIAALSAGHPDRRAVEQPRQTPAFSNRGQFVLVWGLRAAGFLTACYILIWLRLGADMGWECGGAAAFGALSTGLSLSMSARLFVWRSMRGLAAACALQSLCIAVVVVWFAEDSAMGWAGRWWVWVPVVLMGCVLGLAIGAIVERSPRPASSLVSCSITLCLSASAACLVALLQVMDESWSFALLVIIALAWLMLGGLALVHEGGFGLGRRLPQTALMIIGLAFLTLVLPQQSPRWSVMMTGLSRASTGSLATMSHCGPDGLPDASTFSEAAERMSLEAMLRKLRIDKEKYAGIMLTWPTAPGGLASEKMRAALLRTASARLRPEGVLVTRYPTEDASRIASGPPPVR